MQPDSAKSSTTKSSKAKAKPAKTNPPNNKPKSAKNIHAPKKLKPTTSASSSSVSKPQLNVSKGVPGSNPLVVATPRFTLKRQELKPQQTLRQMLEKAEASKGAAADGIKKIKEEEVQARHLEEEEAKKIAKIIDPASATVSKAELDKIQSIITDQANLLEEFKSTCYKQVQEQQQYINELVETLSSIKEAYDNLKLAHTSLSRTYKLLPDPLKDEDQRGKCYFCKSTKHAGMICYQFSSASTRRDELAKEGKCLVCYTAHEAKECPYPQLKRCNCGDKTPHHREHLAQSTSARNQELEMMTPRAATPMGNRGTEPNRRCGAGGFTRESNDPANLRCHQRDSQQRLAHRQVQQSAGTTPPLQNPVNNTCTMLKTMTPSGVTSYKRKVSNAVTKATNLITEANQLLALDPNSVPRINLSNKANDLLTQKLRMVNYQEEIIGLTIDDPQATQDERDTILRSTENHLRQANFPKLFEEMEEARLKLRERTETSVPTSPTCRGVAVGPDSGTPQEDNQGMESPTSERSREPSPTRHYQHDRPPQQQQGQEANRPRGNMEDRVSQIEANMEWFKRTMMQMQMDNRNERKEAQKKHEELLVLFAPGRGDTCRIRSVPSADRASNSTGHGASPGSTNTSGANHAQWRQLLPQPMGFQHNNTGNHNGFNTNGGFVFNNPVATLQNHGIPREDIDMTIRMEQTKANIISSVFDALPKFSGQEYDYPAFISQFDHMVHNNVLIDPKTKQTILVNLLPPTLAREHQTSEVSEANYFMIRNNLERQFNRTSTQFDSVSDQIMALDFPEDPIKLRSALNMFSTLAHKLQSYGVNLSDPLLLKMALNKLPKSVRYPAYKRFRKGGATLNDIINEVTNTISLQQGFKGVTPTSALGYDEGYINQINVNAVTQHQQRHREVKSPAMKKYRFTPPSKETPCRYCDEKDHSATECKMPLEQKRQAVLNKLLCFNCLSEKHSVIECKSKFNCLHCGKRHFTGHCPALSKKGKVNINVAAYVPSSDSDCTDILDPDYSLLSRRKDPMKVLTTTVICNTLSTAEEFTQLLESIKDVQERVEPMKLQVYKITDAQAQLPYIQLHTPTGHKLLALVDSGAQSSIISTQAAERLQLQSVGRRKLLYSGFAGQSPRQWCTFYRLELLDLSANAWTTCVPSYDDIQVVFHAPDHTLEDQEFIERNGFNCEGVKDLRKYDGRKIDLILGNNVMNKIKDIEKTMYFYLPSRRAIEKTLVGFIHHPPVIDDSLVPIDRSKPLSISDDTKELWIHTVNVEDSTTDPADEDNPARISSRRLDKQLERLWTLDVIGLEPPSVRDSKEALNAELISEFKKSSVMDGDGKIYVALPFNGRQTELRNNLPMAKTRLQSLLERQLQKAEDRLEYHDIIMKQVEEGIVEEIPLSAQTEGPEYFIPHRVVIKEDSLTTKLRIVLDASSHMRREISLNDCLHPGPSILQSILGIMIRSRLSKYLMMSDIKRAFHQVRIQEKFRDVTKFLWLHDPSKGYSEENLRAYRFTRLPFGVSSSPFLLAVTILRYLEINENKLNDRIKENLYVDNVILTSNDEEDLKEAYTQSKAIFNMMHMNLREYLSNSTTVMSAVAEQDRHPQQTCKLLGHEWDSINDTIVIKIARPPKGTPTKKQIVAFSARNYDPSGLISPIIVPIKQLISTIWSKDIGWKDKIPEDLLPAWKTICDNFNETTYTIPRQLTTNYEFSSAQLVVFADASKHNYATAAYIRYGFKDGSFSSSLVFSKSRIRPSNGGPEYTIPRMELMALEIAANAAVNLTKELHMNLKDVVLFSDSTCCLFWVLSKVNNNFGSTWVNNRVQKIHKNLLELQQQKLEPTVRYVPSEENPADIASRGCSIKELKDSKLWHYGPEFLQQPETSWPKKLDNTSADPLEFRKQAEKAGTFPELSTNALVVLNVVNKGSDSVPQHAIPYERTFSLHKLTIWITKALQWICRLIQRRNKRHPDKPIQFKDNLLARFWSAFEARDPLVEAELVRKLIIKCHYKDAEDRFNSLPPKRLNPILHEDGSWRFKTRFSDSTDSRLKEDMRFPIIIMSDHPLAKLIVYESHEKLKHQGIQDVISDVHQRYWIEHLNRIVRTIRAQCFLCQRKHGKAFKYNFNRILPASRTTFVGPFQFVGLDYIGPLQYKRSDGQGKLWILLVSCIFTRAVHLEVVPDNTTVSFINGLRRFISRRGAPQFILSDNAPLFKLAYSMINEDLKTIVNKNEELTSYLANKQIKIKLITPLSPWQGGAYERLVGLVKNVIQKTLSKETRSFLEMETLVIDTEAIINSRPVTPNKRAEEDAPAIRPCDFLNPGVQLALPEKVDSVFGVIKPGETEKLTRSLLEGLGRAKEDLWDQFALSYFQTLRELKQQGANHSAQTPKPGMVVLVESAKTKSRLHWPLGRIISISRSLDGAPRSVFVKCGKHIVEKPVNQLVNG
ncbi:hypothetical protein CAEBREN_15675 [Caenorhabditis brenneri]|uniref:Integrase catalytic domain-containing protein n=1 Tax=Caenorhabditis brenneri TaxID=135651 RepID=G0N338_CAEBE|nr:hypothetical protein CAEBREN_15675 [Caenorhabditis brenneri]